MGKRKQQLPPPDSALYQNTTEFRILERTAKRKGPIDHIFLSLEECPSLEIHLFGSTRVCYKFDQFPGFYLVKNAIPAEMQKDIIKEALEEWVKPPNVSNLDSHWFLDAMGLWNHYVQWKHSDSEEPLIRKRVFSASTEMYAEPSTDVNIATNTCNDCENTGDSKESTVFTVDPDTKLLIDKPTDPMASTKDERLLKVLPRLRWTTLGHQYNWTKKEYHFDRVPPFPNSISSICLDIVTAFEHILPYDPRRWKPEAGIVNFYQPGDSLMAHQDKSEPNPHAPLLSISLGLDCAFLMGTHDRNDKPIALRLSSGDLVVMFGQARRAFHGVPRVFEDTCPSYLLSDELEWKDFKEYISHTRMNINVRQVF
jgi:alkylated DNA repair protein alkB family protein 1